MYSTRRAALSPLWRTAGRVRRGRGRSPPSRAWQGPRGRDRPRLAGCEGLNTDWTLASRAGGLAGALPSFATRQERSAPSAVSIQRSGLAKARLRVKAIEDKLNPPSGVEWCKQSQSRGQGRGQSQRLTPPPALVCRVRLGLRRAGPARTYLRVPNQQARVTLASMVRVMKEKISTSAPTTTRSPAGESPEYPPEYGVALKEC